MSTGWRVQLGNLVKTFYGYSGNSIHDRPEVDEGLSDDKLIYFKDDGNRIEWADWMLGATFIAWDANNNGMGSLITGKTFGAGIEIESFDLESDLINFGGYTWSFIAWGISNTGVTTEGIDEFVDISKYIVNLSFSTDINRGFDTAEINLFSNGSILARTLAILGGQDASIFDEIGNKVFEGIVTSTTLDGYEGKVKLSGYSRTNDWFFAVQDYLADDDTVTAPSVIEDQIPLNFYLKKLNLEGIDPGDVLHDAQETDGTYNGIGPFDFDNTPTSLTEAFENVTKFGYYPADPYKDYVLQIWNGRIVIGVPIPKKPGDTDIVNWTLTERNFEGGSAGVSLDTSFEDMVTQRKVVYTDVDGETERTQSAFNFPLFYWFANMADQATSDSLGAGRAISVLRDSVTEPPNVAKAGGVKVVGKARGTRGGFSRPVHHIRAGDIVEIITPHDVGYPLPNGIVSGYKMIVGKTSFSTSKGVMTLTAYGHADAIEKQIMLSELKDA